MNEQKAREFVEMLAAPEHPTCPPLSGALLERPVGAAPLVRRGAQRARVTDRSDLGDVAAEGQPHGPVGDRVELPGEARDAAHVVSAGHPPCGKAAELERSQPPNRLVATE